MVVEVTGQRLGHHSILDRMLPRAIAASTSDHAARDQRLEHSAPAAPHLGLERVQARGSATLSMPPPRSAPRRVGW
jgi:hypothetical protein